MNAVFIEYQEVPPLRRGDRFDATGNLQVDAESLGAIYGIWDLQRLEVDLASFCHPRSITPARMMSNLLDVHPDAERLHVGKFMLHCRLATRAHVALES